MWIMGPLVEGPLVRGLELKKYYYNEAKFHYTITRITLATGSDDSRTPLELPKFVTNRTIIGEKL